MLVTVDNFISTLSAPAGQGSTTLSLHNGAAICAAVAGANYTYLRVGDGTRYENVKVTECNGTVLTLETGLTNSYVAGSCVQFIVSAAVVCGLISQGGCVAPPAPTPAPACRKPSFFAGSPLPEFELNTPANHALAWDGDGPFTTNVFVKPSWMTVTVTGNAALITGTPPDDTAINFQMTVSNACGSAELNSRVCYCEVAGVAGVAL